MRREARDPGILARIALETLELDPITHSRIVLDGVRNTGEIEVLRDRFGPRFFLFARACSASQRWDRLEPTYAASGRTEKDFLDEDRRDRDERNEEEEYGQQVQLCVDQADVLLTNDDQVTTARLFGRSFANMPDW